MSETQAYLLVYREHPTLPGDRWFDRSNDPEMRAETMTWGICRTNVRRWAKVGADLFFLAYPRNGRNRPLSERYYLSAYFHVEERLDQSEAALRFQNRPNVIMEALPPGPSREVRLRAYLKAHLSELAWPNNETIRAELASNVIDLHHLAEESVITIGDTEFVHSYWDHHPKWRERIDAPYLVADLSTSKILESPIPYITCAATCDALPAPERLQSQVSWRHSARKLDSKGTAHLLHIVQSAPGLHRSSDLLPEILLGSNCAPGRRPPKRRKTC